NYIDVMPIPYADLVVPSVTVPGPAFSGQSLAVSWRVENRGIGLTNQSNWSDSLWLASDAAGTHLTTFLGSFTHLGQLAGGDGYDRTANVRLPDGLTGTYYVVVQVNSGVFQFIYTNNDSGVSGPVNVQFTPPPDLIVTEVTAPTLTVQEATPVDIQWTVKNA